MPNRTIAALSNTFIERLSAWFATALYLPVSSANRSVRLFRNRRKFLHATALPRVFWRRVVPPQRIRLVETSKRNGNVRFSELAILAHAAAGCANGSVLFEIGTFDGRTSLNLALNSPPDCRVATMDLPPGTTTAMEMAGGENYLGDGRWKPGNRLLQNIRNHPGAVRKVTQILSDSAKFDPDDFEGRCSLVFVDGSHSFRYAMADSHLALRLVAPDGLVLWHDYGIWKGVTRGLEQFQKDTGLALMHIRGTSLVAARPGHADRAI